MNLVGTFSSKLPRYVHDLAERFEPDSMDNAEVKHILQENAVGEMLLHLSAGAENRLIHVTRVSRNLDSIYRQLVVDERRRPHVPRSLSSVSTSGEDGEGWQATFLRQPLGMHSDDLISPSFGARLRDDHISIRELQEDVVNLAEMLASWQPRYSPTARIKNASDIFAELKGIEFPGSPVPGHPEIIAFDAPPGLDHPMRNPLWFVRNAVGDQAVLVVDACRSLSTDTILMATRPFATDWSRFGEAGRFYEWARLELEILLNFVPPDTLRNWTEFCYAAEGSLHSSDLRIDAEAARGRVAPTALKLINIIRERFQSSSETIPNKLSQATYFLSVVQASLDISFDFSIRPNLRLGAMFYASRALECLTGRATATPSFHIGFPSRNTRKLSQNRLITNAHATLFGVGYFQRGESITQLPTVLNDVRGLSAALEGAGYETVTVLNAAVHSRSIRRELQRLKILPDQATVVIYFGGHGFIEQGKFYVAPFTADPVNVAETCVAWDEIQSWLVDEELFSQRSIIMLDMCHAGAAASLPNITAMPLLSNRLIFSACASDQKAISLPGHEYGLFTEVVLEAFAGAVLQHEETLTVFGLIEYVTRQVARRAAEIGHEQTPVFIGKLRENFRLA